MTIEKGFFRQVMGQFPTGVTVVTTCNKGTLSGLTVNAFCSVSLDPPLVLICVDLNSVTLPEIRESGTFVVNMLTDEQEHLSRCFATASAERYEHFCYASYHTAATGAPVLDDTLAWIDARVVAEYPGGDHMIFLGQVEALGTGGKTVYASDGNEYEAPAWRENTQKSNEKTPLAYYQGEYRHLAQNYRKPSLAVPATAATYYDEAFE